MRVALDADIWIQQRGLRSPLGSALLYTLRENGGKLLLPGSTRLELTYGLCRRVIEASAAVEKGLETIRQIVGRAQEVALPTADVTQAALVARLNDLDEILDPIETTLPLYEAAMKRVLAKQAPNHGDVEEFRDSILAETLIERAVAAELDFATEDSHFLRRRRDGDIPILQEEFNAGGIRIRIHNGLKALLTHIAPTLPPIQGNQVQQVLMPALFPRLEEIATRNGYTIGNIGAVEISAFLTEQLGQLAIEFSLAYEALLVPEPGGVVAEATARVDGTARYFSADNRVEEIALSYLAMNAPNGTLVWGQSINFAAGAVHLGVPITPYRFRHSERLSIRVAEIEE